MKGRPNFHFYFTREDTAASLWDYGEDDLVGRALELSDGDLRLVQNIASVYESRGYPLPLEGRITHNHVTALAAVTFFNSLRPLKRTRRRPEKQRPSALTSEALHAAKLAAFADPASAPYEG
jgi:hypothetical protein